MAAAMTITAQRIEAQMPTAAPRNPAMIIARMKAA